MMSVVLKFVFVLSLSSSAFGARNFQTHFEKCELVSANAALINNMQYSCTKLNDTAFTISASGDLLQEINMDNMQATGQVYLFQDGEYVIMPRWKMTMNACEEYTEQNFGVWNEIENYGNLKGCGVHKVGHYEVKDYPPKVKMMDIAIDNFGRYKVNVKMHSDSGDLMEVDFFAEVKPLAA